MPTIPILADNSSAPNVAYWLAVILVAAGLGLIVLVLLGMRRGFGTTPTYSENLLEAADRSGVATTQEAERLLRLMGEAEEVCTRLGRELDDKAQRLEALLARAEGMLSESAPPAPRGGAPAATSPAQPHEGLYTPPSGGGYPNRPEIVTRPVGVPGQPVAYAGTYSPQRAAQQNQPAPAQAVLGPQPMGMGPMGNGPANDPEALAQQIYRLSDAGLTPGEIAQRLGQHTGKIELIIALRNT
jgi:hypothetical protein